jgi:hypothetical protein
LEQYSKVVPADHQSLDDAQKAVELDGTNLKAHLILGQCLCMIAKQTNDVKRIDTAIVRMSKCRLTVTCQLWLYVRRKT